MRFVKTLFLAFLFIFLVLVFFPKTNLFYLLEKNLSHYNVVLNEKSVDECCGGLTLDGVQVYYDKLHVGDVQSVSAFFAIFYNKISVDQALFSKKIKRFVPREIESVDIQYSIFYPTKIWISSRGDFGEISGEFNIFSNTLMLKLHPKRGFLLHYRDIARNFKKTSKGEYIYEQSFK